MCRMFKIHLLIVIPFEGLFMERKASVEENTHGFGDRKVSCEFVLVCPAFLCLVPRFNALFATRLRLTEKDTSNDHFD